MSIASSNPKSVRWKAFSSANVRLFGSETISRLPSRASSASASTARPGSGKCSRPSKHTIASHSSCGPRVRYSTASAASNVMSVSAPTVTRAMSIVAASLSTPTTEAALSRRIADPYPLPHARSSTLRPPHSAAASL